MKMHNLDLSLVMEAATIATGLHEPDPSDPLRAGYSVQNAVLAALDSMALHDKELNEDERGMLERVIAARYKGA